MLPITWLFERMSDAAREKYKSAREYKDYHTMSNIADREGKRLSNFAMHVDPKVLSPDNKKYQKQKEGLLKKGNKYIGVATRLAKLATNKQYTSKPAGRLGSRVEHGSKYIPGLKKKKSSRPNVPKHPMRKAA